eukprot:398033-Rhodomonas_salina.2
MEVGAHCANFSDIIESFILINPAPHWQFCCRANPAYQAFKLDPHQVGSSGVISECRTESDRDVFPLNSDSRLGGRLLDLGSCLPVSACSGVQDHHHDLASEQGQHPVWGQGHTLLGSGVVGPEFRVEEL